MWLRMTSRTAGSWIVIAVFGISGAWHLISPASFEWLMPPFLPFHQELIVVSGVAELVSAFGLLFRWSFAPALTVATLVAVWVANWWWAIDVLDSAQGWIIALAWVRLPFQIPLALWAWRSPGNRFSKAVKTLD